MIRLCILYLWLTHDPSMYTLSMVDTWSVYVYFIYGWQIIHLCILNLWLTHDPSSIYTLSHDPSIYTLSHDPSMYNLSMVNTWSIYVYFIHGWHRIHLCILYLWLTWSIYVNFMYGWHMIHLCILYLWLLYDPSMYTLSMVDTWSVYVYFIYGWHGGPPGGGTFKNLFVACYDQGAGFLYSPRQAYSLYCNQNRCLSRPWVKYHNLCV